MGDLSYYSYVCDEEDCHVLRDINKEELGKKHLSRNFNDSCSHYGQKIGAVVGKIELILKELCATR